MKILIVYYSKTGNTEKVAKQIGDALISLSDDVEYEKINPLNLKEDSFLKNGLYALIRKEVPIMNNKFNLNDYDSIIFGTPVWAFSTTPPINSYLEDIQGVENKKIIAFVTMDGIGGNSTINIIKSKINQKRGRFLGAIALSKQELANEEILKNKINQIIDVLKK